MACATGVIQGAFNKRITFKGMAGYGKITKENIELQSVLAVTSPGLNRYKEEKLLVPEKERVL